jgi:hypothetical protein
MRTVSFFRPGGGASGAGLTGGGAGVSAGGLGEETGKGGDGGTNWGALSRDFVSAPDGSAASRGGKAMRTVSFFGSFGSGIRRGESGPNHCSKWPTCHSLSSFHGKIWLRRSAKNLSQEIVSAASGDPAPNEFAHRRRLRQNDARIDIRGVRFAAGDMRLINQQL